MIEIANPCVESKKVLLASDGLGSVIVRKGGAQLASRVCCVYGYYAIPPGVTLGFCGAWSERMGEIYLLGNGFRAFNPVLMRFHSPDTWSPFGRGGLNVYGYCGGDPVNYKDPSGHVKFGASIMAGINNWKANAQMSSVYRRAPEAKQYVDDLASGLAMQYGGKILAAPLKKRERAMEKAMGLFGGDPRKSNDIARNTLVVQGSQISSVVNDLKSHADVSVQVIAADKTPLGYSGVHAKISTPSGVFAEMQVHTPEMIYANMPEALARQVLGDSAYNGFDEFSRRHGYKGGQGHKYYEVFRNQALSIRQREEAREEGRSYYSFMTTGSVRL